jgi:hypothetical protein
VAKKNDQKRERASSFWLTRSFLCDEPLKRLEKRRPRVARLDRHYNVVSSNGRRARRESLKVDHVDPSKHGAWQRVAPRQNHILGETALDREDALFRNWNDCATLQKKHSELPRDPRDGELRVDILVAKRLCVKLVNGCERHCNLAR